MSRFAKNNAVTAPEIKETKETLKKEGEKMTTPEVKETVVETPVTEETKEKTPEQIARDDARKLFRSIKNDKTLKLAAKAMRAAIAQLPEDASDDDVSDLADKIALDMAMKIFEEKGGDKTLLAKEETEHTPRNSVKLSLLSDTLLSLLKAEKTDTGKLASLVLSEKSVTKTELKNAFIEALIEKGLFETVEQAEEKINGNHYQTCFRLLQSLGLIE